MNDQHFTLELRLSVTAGSTMPDEDAILHHLIEHGDEASGWGIRNSSNGNHSRIYAYL